MSEKKEKHNAENAKKPRVQKSETVRSEEKPESKSARPKVERPRIVLKKRAFAATTWTHVTDSGKEWFIVDASKAPLGRIASRVATVLMGKHRALYYPSSPNGDFVVVINARHTQLTGKKISDKMYYWHTGFPGGIKSRSAKEMMQKDPCQLLMTAVKGMLPKTKLGRKMFSQLKVYPGAEHPHVAQSPKPLAI